MVCLNQMTFMQNKHYTRVEEKSISWNNKARTFHGE